MMQKEGRRMSWRDSINRGSGGGLQSPYPQRVLIDIAVQPVMDHHVPSAVVVGEGRGVPPVLEKSGVRVGGRR